jgi:hypothetical protein
MEAIGWRIGRIPSAAALFLAGYKAGSGRTPWIYELRRRSIDRRHPSSLGD